MRAIILFVATLAVSSVTFAQEDSVHHGTKQADKMKSVLSLTDAQYQSIQAIDQKYAAKINETKSDNTATKEAIKALKEQRKQEVNKVLSQEQQAKWQAYQEGKKDQRKEMKDSRREELRNELNLTPEQEVKMKEIQRNFSSQKKTVMADQSLTKEARASKIQALKDERQTKLKAILTAEQYEKLKEEKEERHDEKGHSKNHGGHRKK